MHERHDEEKSAHGLETSQEKVRFHIGSVVALD